MLTRVLHLAVLAMALGFVLEGQTKVPCYSGETYPYVHASGKDCQSKTASKSEVGSSGDRCNSGNILRRRIGRYVHQG
jgi:hypothetical protein